MNVGLVLFLMTFRVCYERIRILKSQRKLLIFVKSISHKRKAKKIGVVVSFWIMEQGISGDSLLEMIFDRFWGRKLYCKTKDGREIEGEVCTFDYDGEEMYLIVETEKGNINLKQKEVEFIKSLPFDDE